MIEQIDVWLEEIDQDGFTVLSTVFTSAAVDTLLAALSQVFQSAGEDAAVRSDAGSVYAARNVLALWPQAATAWRRPPLPEAIAALLGPHFGLVRALYFDKLPERTWALSWHKLMVGTTGPRRPPAL